MIVCSLLIEKSQPTMNLIKMILSFIFEEDDAIQHKHAAHRILHAQFYLGMNLMKFVDEKNPYFIKNAFLVTLFLT